MRSSTELDNLLEAGENYRNEPDGKDGHFHAEATGGFDYYDAIFKVGNKYYYGLVNIMVTNGRLWVWDDEIGNYVRAYDQGNGNFAFDVEE